VVRRLAGRLHLQDLRRVPGRLWARRPPVGDGPLRGAALEPVCRVPRVRRSRVALSPCGLKLMQLPIYGKLRCCLPPSLRLELPPAEPPPYEYAKNHQDGRHQGDHPTSHSLLLTHVSGLGRPGACSRNTRLSGLHPVTPCHPGVNPGSPPAVTDLPRGALLVDPRGAGGPGASRLPTAS
jgi:hypothetical protein